MQSVSRSESWEVAEKVKMKITIRKRVMKFVVISGGIFLKWLKICYFYKLSVDGGDESIKHQKTNIQKLNSKS